MDTNPNDLKTTLSDLENRLSVLEGDYRITQRKQEMTCVNVLKKLGALVALSVFVFLGTVMTAFFMFFAFAALIAPR